MRATLVSNAAHGELPERPKGADCKSAVIDFVGSNPPLATSGPLRKQRAFLLPKMGPKPPPVTCAYIWSPLGLRNGAVVSAGRTDAE